MNGTLKWIILGFAVVAISFSQYYFILYKSDPADCNCENPNTISALSSSPSPSLSCDPSLPPKNNKNKNSYNDNFYNKKYRGSKNKFPTQFSTSFKQALEQHEKRQKEMINSSDPKWVVSSVQGMGLSNRLQVLASGFLLALLTERAFAINWPGSSNGGVNSNINNEGALQMLGIDEIFVAPFEWSSGNAHGSKRILDGNWGSKDFNIFLCDDVNNVISENIIEVSGWDYYAPFLSHNPIYREKVAKWFGAPDNVYGPILRYLAKLQPPIQQQVDDFVNQKFRTYTVGMHLRMTGNLNYKMEKQHEDAAFQCAGIPFSDSVNPAGAISFPGFDENGEFRSLPPENVTIFLATDSPTTAENAKKKFGNRLIMLESNAPLSRGSREGIIRGVVDLFVLSRCDDLVVSFQSSYSRVAASISGVAPLQITHEAKCARDITAEPCACGWRKVNTLRCYDSKLHDTPYAVNQYGCSTCDGSSRFQEGPSN